MAKIIVCGGRDYTDAAQVARILKRHTEPLDRIITGGARGADHLAELWAIANGRGLTRYHADWDTHGKAAGPIRNRKMLNDEQPDLVIAFPGGAGTADMVKIARKAGVKVIECGLSSTTASPSTSTSSLTK